VILRRLRLRDFRQFRGEHEVVFASGSDRNVTVLTGVNGAGKTGLFYALNWALYGEAETLPGSLVNKAAAQEPTPRSWVEVAFVHDGSEFIARRELGVTPSGYEREISFTLSRLDSGGRVKEIQDPSAYVNVILPKDARRYFFFDGERIDELSRPGHEQEVREAVRSVLKLKVLERTSQHLDDAAKDYQKALRQQGQLDDEQRGLIDAAEELDRSIRAREDELAELRQRITKLEHQVQGARAKLDRLVEIREIQAERREVEALAERLRADFDDASETLREAVGRGAAVVAASALERARAVLEEKRAAGEIPTGIRQQLIEDLLRERICICGRPLDEPATEALTARHGHSVSSDVAESVLNTASDIRLLQARAADTSVVLERGVARRAELREDMTDNDRRLEDISERLRGDFTEDVAQLEESRRYLEDRLRDSLVEAKVGEREMGELRAQLAKTRAQLGSLESRSVEGERAKRRWELATASAEAARVVLTHFSADMRGRIEDATDEIFKMFVWKEKQFLAVRVTEDYKLEVDDRFGTATLAGLSAGERQVLSLAFIAGMSKVTGEEAPIVIDTPFGRLSEMPVTSIVTELPKIAKQLVLFVTDREMDDEARSLIEPRIGREYSLEFDDSVGETSIEATR
jgi:DNA sulfur modification protein DndD